MPIPERFAPRLNRLREINVLLRRQLERAELHLPPIHNAIRDLARLDFTFEKFFVGDVIYDRTFGPSSPTPNDSAIAQAVISSVRGLGILEWGLEDWLAHCREPEVEVGALESRFQPYEQLTAAYRAMLLPHIGKLIDKLCNDFPQVRQPQT